jgi:F-type H+-transporting ATPase subunit epsilon
MAENKFNFELVTPEQVLVSGEIQSVSIPGVEGDMTVLPDHAPVATAIRPGYLEVQETGKSERYFLSGGFVEISQQEVIILAETAVLGAELSSDIVGELIAKTEKSLENASELQRYVLAKKLNDLNSIQDQLLN